MRHLVKDINLMISTEKSRCVRDLAINVGIITCWYKNISMANYSYNLKAGLEKYPFVNVKIVSSRCSCARARFTGSKDVFQDENCQLVSFPPYVHLYPKKKISWIFYTIVQVFLHSLRGMVYLSKCKFCDVIHYQQSAFSLGILPLIPVILIPTPNKKIITAHTLDKTAGLKILKKIYNRADKIIVHSKDLRETLIWLGVHASKIEVIPHGAKIPTLLFKERNKITFFGAPIEQKGTFVLFEALRMLKEKGEKIKVHFYGIYSASEKESAEIRAKESSIDDCIVWGGRLSEQEFDMRMQESMFTFAVYTDPVSGSNILTRAMANATPVIATSIGGIPEYSQRFDVLIPPNDPKALADAISKLAKDLNLRRELGNIARRAALKISWNAIARKNLGVYVDALKHQRKSLYSSNEISKDVGES